MQHKSVPLLIKSADDQSGLSQSPRERPPVGLNRHWTDLFKNGRPASGDQAKWFAADAKSTVRQRICALPVRL